MVPLDAFVVVARDYCAVVDRAEELGRDAFLETIEPLIARIYAAGAELGNPHAFDGDEFEASRDPGKFFARLRMLTQLLGDADSFTEPVEMSLASALAEIYEDLESGLTAFADGRHADAGYELSFGVQYHWGYHAWEALAAIHSYRRGIGH